MPLTNADKIRNAEIMHGTGSKQHLAAKKKFGTHAKAAKGGSGKQARDKKGRFK